MSLPARGGSAASPLAGELRLLARVTAMRDVGAQVREIVLEAAPGERWPPFEAGAHIDVTLRPGVVRQYSLLNDPRERDRYVIAVRQSGDGEAARLHERLAVGRTVAIGTPRNSFALDPSAKDVLLVAGGIGLTPMLAMAHALTRRPSSFALHLCARSAEGLPYADEIAGWPFRRRTHLHFDDGPDEQQLGDDDLGAWRAGRLLYLCGPGGFVTAVTTRARRMGWPDAAIRTECFSPLPSRAAPRATAT